MAFQKLPFYFKKIKGKQKSEGDDFSYLQKTWLIDQRVG